MGGALPPALADHRAHHKWHVAGIAIEHVPPLGRQVDELIKPQKKEIIARVHDDRPLAHGGGADDDAGERILHGWRIEYACRAESLGRLSGRSEDAGGIIDADAGDEDRGVTLHGLAESLRKGLRVSYFTHWRSRLSEMVEQRGDVRPGSIARAFN